jgi:hypothetical protein
MPKKLTNQDIMLKYIESVDNIAEQTKKTYINIANNLPFNILTSQNTIIKKLNNLYENPNTQALNLNMIILTRRYNKEPTDKLINHRNSLRDKIVSIRKKKMSEIKDILPSYEEIIKKLNELKGLPYIINYLFITYGLRNKDINLKNVSHNTYIHDIDDDQPENYIIQKRGKVLIYIQDYKTVKTFDTKSFVIKDKKFIKELKDLKLNDNDYLISKKNGDKLKTTSFNERVVNLSIDKLGEAKIFKIVIGNLLNKKDFNEIEKLTKSRGTSIATILKSYNIYNNDSNETKQLEEMNESSTD